MFNIFKKQKTLEEIEAEKKTAEEKKKRGVKINEYLGNLELFLGSLEEYEKFKGEKYEIVDTGETRKFVRFETLYGIFKDLDWLYDNKIDALIRFSKNTIYTPENYGTEKPP